VALILCSVGWQESRGVTVSVAVGLPKILNVILLSKVFVMVTSRKLILLSCSVFIVYCMDGVILLNLSSTSLDVRDFCVVDYKNVINILKVT
jgi:hypothetical protein